MPTRLTRTLAVMITPLLAATACAGPSSPPAGSASTGAPGKVTVTNCGQELTLPGTAKRLYVNDGNIIALTLAAGGAKEIAAVSSLNRDKETLKAKYGAEVVDGLKEVSKDYPTLESILANRPDLVVAGWNYGFSEGKNLTPDLLKEKGIESYLLTESCRQQGTTKRGLVDPWEAVRTDITNLGSITGHGDIAKKAVADIDERLKALKAAPAPARKPVLFVFDSAKDSILTSGFYGAPNAIINTAGGMNATADVKDTWTNVNWEKLASSKPDVFVFVDYPGQSYQEKVKVLKSNPVTKDLPAVKEARFINLPYAMWTESPLNVDAAEFVRKGLERFTLAPDSNVATHMELPASLPGQETYR